MTLFLTGASGYIGGSVALALVQAGYRVRGLTRHPGHAEQLAALGIEPVLGDLDDGPLLMREAQAADGVINAAHADHAGAVQALLAGLTGSGKLLLHTSGSSVVGDDVRGNTGSAQVFDESTPLLVQPAKQSRRAIDLAVLAAAAQNKAESRHGIRACVICPSLVYGAGRGLNPHSVQIPFMVANAQAQGEVQVVGAGLNVWSFVHVDDLMDLYLLAVAKAPPGAFYFAENGEAAWGDIGQAVAQRLGVGLGRVDAEDAAQRWGEARAYYSLGSNSRVRAQRARQELGWVPRQAPLLSWIAQHMPVAAPPTSLS